METAYEYSWSPGRGRSVAAELVGSTIEQIQHRNGGSCAPAALVDEARPESSPLHSLFEWDDSAAAEAYRQDQARGVIRNLRVQRVVDPEPTPAFISVTLSAPQIESVDGIPASPPKRGYVPAAKVLSEQDLYSQALSECVQQLRGLQRRFSWLKECAGVWEAIEALSDEEV